ncbi:hypothetical protein KY328_04475 [Candidatus Woesearchaeota archaeon]|nr:hypothetical protein [Candidatus Woesearchaeota archaeon]MBW3022155.1 hypothetical protein [Candidatus Woesearchaeota archaeon]
MNIGISLTYEDKEACERIDELLKGTLLEDGDPNLFGGIGDMVVDVPIAGTYDQIRQAIERPFKGKGIYVNDFRIHDEPNLQLL